MIGSFSVVCVTLLLPPRISDPLGLKVISYQRNWVKQQKTSRVDTLGLISCLNHWDPTYIAGWWFQTFFMFIPIWGNDPI